MAAVVAGKPARQVLIVTGDAPGVVVDLARRVMAYAVALGAYRFEVPAPYRSRAGNWCVWLELVGVNLGIGQIVIL